MYGDQYGEFVCGYWGLKGYPVVLISLSHMVNGVQLAQLEGFWSAEQEVVSPNPGRTTFIPTKVFEKIKTVRSY